MDKKHKTAKNSLRQPFNYLTDKTKKLRTITIRTQKFIQPSAEQKYMQLSKSKKLPLNSKRQMYKSALPFDSPLVPRDSQKQQLKLCQSNISCTDLHRNFSGQKTLKMIKSNQKPKGNSKLVKRKRKTQWFKEEKVEQQKKSKEKYQPTVRKVCYVQDDYQILYKKTQKILQEYKQRETQWQQQKQTLMEQLQDLRRKSMGMALTSCSSYSLNRRNMF